MSQKGIIKNSITSDCGAPELASLFKGLFGPSGILSIYSNLACTKIYDNLVRLSAGVYNLSGYLLQVTQGTTCDLAVDSGTAGQSRNDLIIASFVRNGSGAGIDTLEFKILKGVSTTGVPVDPTLTQQDINGVGVTRQEPLFRITIVGTGITTIVQIASVLHTLTELQANLDAEVGVSVDLTGNQTVAGIKTFTSIPEIPITAPTSDTQVINKGYVDAGYDSLLLTVSPNGAAVIASSIQAIKVGRLVILTGYFTETITGNDLTLIGVSFGGKNPSYSQRAAGADNAGHTCQFVISTDGTILCNITVPSTYSFSIPIVCDL